MPLVTQAGYCDEGTYGTPGTPDHFPPGFVNEEIKALRPRIESKALWSGSRFARKEGVTPSNAGAVGKLGIELWTKGFGELLEHCLGSVSSSGPTDSKYVHTATPGSLLGQALTVQFNKPFHPSGTSQPWTLHGVKIKSWELSCKAVDETDGIWMLVAEVDAEDLDTSTSLASVSYPSGAVPFTYGGSAFTIGGNAVHPTEFKVSCDNGIDFKKYMRNSVLKKEPFEKDLRKLEWSMTLDFDSLDMFDIYRDADAADIMEQIVATVTAPVLIGSSSQPTLVVTIDEAQFDEYENQIGGTEPLEQKIGGAGKFDGSNPAISIAYGTADSSP